MALQQPDAKRNEGPYCDVEAAKKQIVTCFPDIKKIARSADHDFIVCACDGIWDCYTNEEAAKFAAA